MKPELKKYYSIKVDKELMEIIDVFDKEYRDVLDIIGYKSIVHKGRKRPITFIRTLFCDLCNEISPIFGDEKENIKEKLITQKSIGFLLGIDRSTLPHHRHRFELDKYFFKPLYDIMTEKIRPQIQDNINNIKDIMSTFDAFSGKCTPAPKSLIKINKKYTTLH